MSDTTHPIDLEPIVSAPTDARAFEAILGNAPHVLEVVRFENGRWHVYRGTVPSPTPGAAHEMHVWQPLAEGIYPTHYVKGSVGRVPQPVGTKQAAAPEAK